jgi:hypothetical protein
VKRLRYQKSKKFFDYLEEPEDFEGGNPWELLVSFTLEELKQHLESQFHEGMTWDNYGIFWEIDHIMPVSKCTSLEETWALSNLQPLTKRKNRSKGNRVTWREGV